MAEMKICDQEDIIRFCGDLQLLLESCLLPERGEIILPGKTGMPVFLIDPAFTGKIVFRKYFLAMHDRDPKAGLIEEGGFKILLCDREEPIEPLPKACSYRT